MEIFSALLVLCARNSPVTGEFSSQRPVTRSFDVFFNLRLKKRLSKQSILDQIRKTHIWNVSLSQNATKISKINRPWQNLIRWSEYRSMWYFMPFPHAFSRKCQKTLDLTRFICFFFGLCDIEIYHMTLKIWEPKAAGVSNHLIKYQCNRWWMKRARKGWDRQTNRQTDRQTDRRTDSLPQRRMTYTTHHNTEQVTKT